MTKKELSRYFWLRHEINRQKERLRMLEDKMQRETVTVVDCGVQYRNGKAKACRMEGIAETDTAVPAMIIVLQQEIKESIRKAETCAAEIESYIQGVEDPRLREILRCRFIDCLDWDHVGVVNYIAPDYARQLVYKHLNSGKIKYTKNVYKKIDE